MTKPLENQHFDRKSLRKVIGQTADFDQLARDCVCFANSTGGTLLLGIEDDADTPPADQRIDVALLDRIRKRVGELTVNVQVVPEMKRHENGGDYITLTIPRALGVASTSDGHYFLRVGDTCRPIVGDDVMRLASERPAIPWEDMTSLGVAAANADAAKVERLCERLRSSDRVKSTVKEKSDQELINHYGLTRNGLLTNLGILLIGGASDRASLGSSPIVQAIKYDDRELKVAKWSWDDHEFSPIDLVDVIWNAVPDFRESYELPDGMLRTKLPAYDELVVRELLVNALVHRPYTQRGDIFLNLYSDRLEIVNPGRLPIGVTPQNILHESRRRNDALARIFHDLKLMEREGSGIDLLYERLLSTGRKTPTIWEGIDSMHVAVPRRVVLPGIIKLLVEADQRYLLTQRERITLALIAQSEAVSAIELAEQLELTDTMALRSWLGRLITLSLVNQSGRSKATRYFVPPPLLRKVGLDTLTTLTRVQPHRLRTLVFEDLERFPDSSRPEIHRRVGTEIPERTLRRTLEDLVKSGDVLALGEKRWRRYRLKDPNDHGKRSGQ